MTDLAWVALGGGCGAVCRHVVSEDLAFRFGRAFPYGTLAVNVAGAFLLGEVAGHALHHPSALLFIGTGFLGGLTTFSTFAADTFAALRDARPKKALLNTGLNLTLGLAATILGFSL